MEREWGYVLWDAEMLESILEENRDGVKEFVGWFWENQEGI